MTSEERNLFQGKCGAADEAKLLSMKTELEDEIEKQKNVHATTSFVVPILLIVFGGIFCIVLVGIPFLVLGIQGLRLKIRTRMRSNRAIWDAREKIAVIDSVLAKRQRNQGAIEVPAEVIYPK